MECIEARALKPSFLSQMAAKTNSPVFYDDDFWCLAGINGASSDDFPVEDLLNLDFPEKECFSREDDEEKVELVRNSNNSSSTFSGADKFDSLSTGGIPVPVGELEKLEWLSQFIDDSTAELSLLCPAGSFTETGWFHHDARVEPACGPVPKKRRSKRSRARRRPWCLASPPLSAAESSSTSSSYSSLASPLLLFTKPAAQKQKKKPEADDGSVSGRRCAHCQVQKTPQWRTGPLGPKTLCNACGVRFKSGRLFPEYRPACSPTFSHEMHSNSHQKVLEMRRKREMAQVG